MEKPILKVVLCHANATLPCYAHPGDSGLDLIYCLDQPTVLFPGDRKKIRTYQKFELPVLPQPYDLFTLEMQIRPRSSLTEKSVDVKLGTVDNGYRGEVSVTLVNNGCGHFQFEKGMKFAQVVVAPILCVDVVETVSLSKTSRGEGGWGSTDLL